MYANGNQTKNSGIFSHHAILKINWCVFFKKWLYYYFGIYVMNNLKYPLLVLEICGNICLFHLKALYVYSGLSLAIADQMVVVLVT